MAKHFAVVYSNGHRVEFAKNACFEAFNVQNYGEAQQFFLAGESVDAETYYAETKSLCNAWVERKDQTHKLVRVRYGSSVACYVWKWVRR